MTCEAKACAMCGGEIPAERIEAVPETRVCVACAREMGGTDVARVARPVKVGRTGGLKHLVTEYETVKVPKPIPRKGE
jgi:hypothetical protein